MSLMCGCLFVSSLAVCVGFKFESWWVWLQVVSRVGPNRQVGVEPGHNGVETCLVAILIGVSSLSLSLHVFSIDSVVLLVALMICGLVPLQRMDNRKARVSKGERLAQTQTSFSSTPLTTHLYKGC